MFFGLTSRKKLPLTGIHRRILLEQVVDDKQPGTILNDANAMLAFIGCMGQPVSNTNKWLTAKSLAPLNEQMTHPLRLVNLTRPQQKSYSNIHGLYLVLRCSGLLGVGKSKAQTVLFVDEQMQEAWAALNPTERYFSLLEAWLLRSNEEVIGNQTGIFSVPPIGYIPKFVQALPQGGADTTNSHNFENDLRFTIGLHHIALLEIFGIVSIELDTLKDFKGWPIERVICTSYGDALLRLLSPLEKYQDRNPSANDVTIGIQSVVQPLFPQCQHLLAVPTHEFQEGVYVFTVSLWKAWRGIAISGRSTFEHLSSAILNAFGFDHGHLYRFSFRDRFGVKQNIDHPFLENDAPATTEVAIGDVPMVPGNIMVFEYDFGDNWEFEVILEAIQPPDPNLKKPKVLEQFGKAPKQYS